MKMKLYGSATSPYTRRVRVLAQEWGLAELIEDVAADPFNPPAEMLSANPMSRIPTLITDRGDALPDSRLIIDFLHSRRRTLAAPLGGRARWAAQRREQIAVGIMDAAVATVLEKRRPESIVYTVFLDRQAKIIERCLAALEAEVVALDTELPGVVEVSVGVALAYLDFRLPYLEWRKTHAPLGEWQTQFAQRPSMQSTQPPT